MTTIDWKKLSAPFPEDEIKWRVGSCGEKGGGEVWCQVLAYLDARAIMERFDDVVGPAGWSTSYREIWGDGEKLAGVECTLKLKVGSEWVGKVDVGVPSDVEALKGCYSDALKRAAVHWGLGRHLYDMGTSWAVVGPSGQYQGKTKNGTRFKWDPPPMKGKR